MSPPFWSPIHLRLAFKLVITNITVKWRAFTKGFYWVTVDVGQSLEQTIKVIVSLEHSPSTNCSNQERNRLVFFRSNFPGKQTVEAIINTWQASAARHLSTVRLPSVANPIVCLNLDKSCRVVKDYLFRDLKSPSKDSAKLLEDLTGSFKSHYISLRILASFS